MTQDYKKHHGANHNGAARSAPYPVSRLAPNTELVDLARQIAQADSMINTRVSAQLHVIAEQIRQLQQQARTVLEAAKHDHELHRASCQFKRIPGRTYHLYRRPNGQFYFSMLSPQDWNTRPPHEFQGSYRLENDMSWTAAEHIEQHDLDSDKVLQLLTESGLTDA